MNVRFYYFNAHVYIPLCRVFSPLEHMAVIIYAYERKLKTSRNKPAANAPRIEAGRNLCDGVVNNVLGWNMRL